MYKFVGFGLGRFVSIFWMINVSLVLEYWVYCIGYKIRFWLIFKDMIDFMEIFGKLKSIGRQKICLLETT